MCVQLEDLFSTHTHKNCQRHRKSKMAQCPEQLLSPTPPSPSAAQAKSHQSRANHTRARCYSPAAIINYSRHGPASYVASDRTRAHFHGQRRYLGPAGEEGGHGSTGCANWCWGLLLQAASSKQRVFCCQHTGCTTSHSSQLNLASINYVTRYFLPKKKSIVRCLVLK